MSEYGLDDKMMFGEFYGMTVRKAIERNPRLLFKMQNGTAFKLSQEALELLKTEML